MTEKKRFKLHINWYNIEKTEGEATLTDNGQPLIETEQITDARLLKNILNDLYNENEELKKELTIYRKVASCSNCKYHNYDWYDDGDEFEVCDKGNDVTDGICEDWVEL